MDKAEKFIGETQINKDPWAGIFFLLVHNDAQRRANNNPHLADRFLQRAKAMSGLSEEEFEQKLAAAREAYSDWEACQDESLGGVEDE